MGIIEVTETIRTPSINNGPVAGFRNAIINGNFNINQRGYVSGAATTVGQYTLDRWAVTNTLGLIFTSSQNKTTVTIPVGQTIKQVIEGVNLQTGKYVLSWEGTAQGRVNGGSYGGSGSVIVDVVGGVNTTVEFNSGTLTNVQFEPGEVATRFELRPPSNERDLCKVYGRRLVSFPLGVTINSTNLYSGVVPLSPAMRTPPTLSVGASYAVGSGTAGTPTLATSTVDAVQFSNSAANWNLNTNCVVTGFLNAEIPI